MPLERGASAIVVPVPGVEPVVSGWRQRFDSSAAQGMPAHITVLFPFLPESRLSPEVLTQVDDLCAVLAPFEVSFAQTARFPDVLYLDPEPADGLRALTQAIVDRWPEAPPYGGAYAGIVPHLTVARAQAVVLDAIDVELQPRLPLAVTLEEAGLYVFDGHRWQVRASLPFRGASRGGSGG